MNCTPSLAVKMKKCNGELKRVDGEFKDRRYAFN